MYKFAVFGYPIQHSYSPQLHQIFAEQTHIAHHGFRYTKECIEPAHFQQQVRAFFQQGGNGLNITVPFKQEAFTMAQAITDRAQAAGAVNTLWLKDNILFGDNTDGIGLVKDIRRLGIALESPILLIGAGGAAKGVALPLLQAGCTQLHIANRTESKAVELIESVRAYSADIPLSASGLENIPPQAWTIIINASASSLSTEELAIPSRIFAHCALAYDMVYHKTASTPFLQQAQHHGAKQCADGLGMLVYQGAEAFSIWTGKYPKAKAALTELRTILQQA